MDEGLPIAYGVLEKGVAVYASDGTNIGVVDHVVAASQQDIFHGLVISIADRGRRFVEAADVAALHERGVDLRIDSAAAAALPEPAGAAPVYADAPAAMARGWHHWVEHMRGHSDWGRES